MSEIDPVSPNIGMVAHHIVEALSALPYRNIKVIGDDLCDTLNRLETVAGIVAPSGLDRLDVTSSFDASPLTRACEALRVAVEHITTTEVRIGNGRDCLAEYLRDIGPVDPISPADQEVEPRVMEQREDPKAAPETSNRDLIADVRERCTGQSLQEKAYIHGSDVHSGGLVVPGMPGWSPNFNKISEPQQSAAGTPARPETAQTGLARQEKILEETFAATVPSIDIRSVVVAVEGRNMPKSLGEYRFIPLVRNPELRRNPGSLYDDRSLSYTARCYNLPDGVRATCDKARPYLDTGFAIGLVRGDWLIAVAGAGLTDEGQLKIIQLQDVTGDEGKNTPENPKGQFKTGLHDGFLWRNTLVEAWSELARRTGVVDEIIVQSAANSMYDRVQKPIKTDDGTAIPRGHEGFDAVAAQQGFIPQPKTRDWVKKLTNDRDSDTAL